VEALPNRQYYLVSRVTVTVRHPSPLMTRTLYPLQASRFQSSPNLRRVNLRDWLRVGMAHRYLVLLSLLLVAWYLADAVKAAPIVLLRFWNILRW
jgi:hypothetical protein